MTKHHRLEENLGAVNVELTPPGLREIESAASKIPVQGARLPESVLKPMNGWSRAANVYRSEPSTKSESACVQP